MRCGKCDNCCIMKKDPSVNHIKSLADKGWTISRRTLAHYNKLASTHPCQKDKKRKVSKVARELGRAIKEGNPCNTPDNIVTCKFG